MKLFCIAVADIGRFRIALCFLFTVLPGLGGGSAARLCLTAGRRLPCALAQRFGKHDCLREGIRNPSGRETVIPLKPRNSVSRCLGKDFAENRARAEIAQPGQPRFKRQHVLALIALAQGTIACGVRARRRGGLGARAFLKGKEAGRPTRRGRRRRRWLIPSIKSDGCAGSLGCRLPGCKPGAVIPAFCAFRR